MADAQTPKDYLAAAKKLAEDATPEPEGKRKPFHQETPLRFSGPAGTRNRSGIISWAWNEKRKWA